MTKLLSNFDDRDDYEFISTFNLLNYAKSLLLLAARHRSRVKDHNFHVRRVFRFPGLRVGSSPGNTFGKLREPLPRTIKGREGVRGAGGARQLRSRRSPLAARHSVAGRRAHRTRARKRKPA